MLGVRPLIIVLGCVLGLSACNCGPMPKLERSDGGVDAGLPIFGVFWCQALCERIRPNLERDFGVPRVDCSQFPVLTSTCLECGQRIEATFGLTPTCE